MVKSWLVEQVKVDVKKKVFVYINIFDFYVFYDFFVDDLKKYYLGG